MLKHKIFKRLDSLENSFYRMTIPVIIVIVSSFYLISIVIYKASIKLDQQEISVGHEQIAAELKIEKAKVDKLAVEWSRWDDVTNNVLVKYSPVWTEFNMGPWLYDGYNVHHLYVLDSKNKQVYSSFKNDETFSTNYKDLFANRSSDLDLFAMIKKARSYPMDTSVSVSDYITIKGVTYVIAVISITKQTPTGPDLIIHDRPIIIMTTPVDNKVLSAISEKKLFNNVRFIKQKDITEDSISYDIANSRKHILQTVAWDAEKPGTKLIHWLLPWIYGLWIIVIVCITIIIFITLQAKKNLSTQNRISSLGNLVSVVAHELKHPLKICASSISIFRNFTRILNTETEDLNKVALNDYLSSSKRTLEILSRSIDRSKKLVDIFGMISKQYTDIKKFNLNTTLQQHIKDIVEIKEDLSDQLQNIKINLECPPDIIVEYDPQIFYLILQTLIDNSLVHAFPTHKGTINIRVTKKFNTILLSYTDDGNGIPLELKDDIFAPFSTSKASLGHLGLGLHILYNILTSNINGTILCNHGGHGRGAEFIMKFK